LRFLFRDFFVKMWLLNALLRRIFPEPVMRNRLWALLFVLIFGMMIPSYLQTFARWFGSMDRRDPGRSQVLGGLRISTVG